jgi:hypothetical protein
MVPNQAGRTIAFRRAYGKAAPPEKVTQEAFEGNDRHLFLFDNSPRTPSVIALEEQGRLRIMKPDAYDTLVAQYGNSD